MGFDEHHALEHLRHYLPAQAALKDFVHHNTLHAFQQEAFHDALWQASVQFGYSTYLSVDAFRAHYRSGRILPQTVAQVVGAYCAAEGLAAAEQQAAEQHWKDRMLNGDYSDVAIGSRLDQLRGLWKSVSMMNMDKVVQPILFRLLAAFLDQGVSIWQFPNQNLPFLDALRALERNGYVSLFKTPRPRQLLLDAQASLTDLLTLVVGDARYFEQYLFDQQFSHPGWSGFVSVVEQQPETLLSTRTITLRDLVYLELLLEIDALDDKLPGQWQPLSAAVVAPLTPLFAEVVGTELKTVLRLWQEAFEWSYFDGVLHGIQQSAKTAVAAAPVETSFQGLFCIDDREYSFRRLLEQVSDTCDTYGTPGFFGVEFYFQQEHGKFYTKACPAPVTPGFLIKETERKRKRKQDLHYSKYGNSLFRGWLIANTLGFWSALRLFIHLFRPTIMPAARNSFAHMDKHARLQIDATGETENGLQIGYTHAEMALRVGNVLKSIGLTRAFAPIVYIVGHGGSSVNNPYYAGYDCGACCGRPGAVNARVFAYMANHRSVRELLRQAGIDIPDATLFVGAMHDTTRDEMEYYEEYINTEAWQRAHDAHKKVFRKALALNAQERSYRFDTVNSGLPLKQLHKAVKRRSVSLFEPRPEWNHTDNALCIVGRKALYAGLYLDKRPFINSYDYSQDPDGRYLLNILNAAIPVCGGINLEYYFSRVDQMKLGAGTKLPHNIVGLFALNNGVDGDLRPGLPSQMVEIHEPVRILFVIEHIPAVVLRVIQSNPAIYEWVVNEWVLMTVSDPETQVLYRFREGQFHPYTPQAQALGQLRDEADMLRVIRKETATLLTTKPL